MAAELYDLTQAMTAAAGLPAYEVSNHARPGAEDLDWRPILMPNLYPTERKSNESLYMHWGSLPREDDRDRRPDGVSTPGRRSRTPCR